MRISASMRRWIAAFIAMVAWSGLLIQWVALWSEFSPLASLWVLSQYFTIWTNLLVAVVFTGIAASWQACDADWIVAGTMLAIVLVGVVYALLLHGTFVVSGAAAVANVVTHMIVPVLVPIYWLCLQNKNGLRWRDPLRWALYPLVYLAVSLTRGGITGKYPYPFLNVATLGWPRTLTNAAGIALAFLITGAAVVGMSRVSNAAEPNEEAA